MFFSLAQQATPAMGEAVQQASEAVQQQAAPAASGVVQQVSEAVQQKVAPAASEAVHQVTEAVQQKVDYGRELINTMMAWLKREGPEFAIKILVACALYFIGAYLIRLATLSARKAIQKSRRVNALLETFICNIVTKGGWVVLMMLILQYLGIPVAPLIASVSVTGIIVGFACQESLANLAAGMMIALNQPFKPGDFVSAGDVQGAVAEVNMMATILLTPDYKKITVPNKVIWGTAITNFSAMERRRVEIAVSVAYGADLAKARRIMLDMLRANPLVLADPPPLVEIMAIDTPSVNFVIRPWCKPSDYWAVFFGTTAAIKEAFDKNNIAIAVPEQVVRLIPPP